MSYLRYGMPRLSIVKSLFIFNLLQADDLFMGSFVWDIESHSNPLTTVYRITGQDLQYLAEYVMAYYILCWIY